MILAKALAKLPPAVVLPALLQVVLPVLLQVVLLAPLQVALRVLLQVVALLELIPAPQNLEIIVACL